MNTNKQTYTVTTNAGKTYSVESDLDLGQAARIILAAEGQSEFAKDIARKAAEAHAIGSLLSPKQTAWLQVLAGWASKPKSQRDTSLDLRPIIDLLYKAAEAQKRAPFIALRLEDNDVLIRLARSAHANVTSGGPFETRIWFGRINSDGSFVRGRACTDEVQDLLVRVSKDPAKVASQHGVATGECCFCARALTTKESRSVGYGPICADKFGLPWGTIDPDLEAKGKEKFSA